MDDAEGESAGFGAWAWYEIGRSSARRLQQRLKTRDMVLDALSPVDPALHDPIIAQANRRIESWMTRCKALEDMVTTNEAEARKLKDQMALLQEQLDLALKCYEAVSSDSHARLLRIEALELELEQLRKSKA